MPTTERFKFRNEPNEVVDRTKEWVRENQRIATSKEEDVEYFTVEVFSHNNHKERAKELYDALLKSEYLKNTPLNFIRIDPM